MKLGIVFSYVIFFLKSSVNAHFFDRACTKSAPENAAFT